MVVFIAERLMDVMKKIKCLTAAVCVMLLLAGCGDSEIQEKKDLYRQKGINCMREGDYEGAIDAFQDALDQSLAVVGASEIDTCFYKAAAQSAAGRPEESAATYQAVIDYDESNIEAYYLLGTLYLKQGNTEQAKKNYSEAITKAKGDFQVYLAVYRQYMDAGMETEAQQCLQTALEQGGKSGEDYAHRGHIYLLLGDYDKAKAELALALEKESDLAPLYMGQLCEAQGESDLAVMYFEEYAKNHQEDSCAMGALGDIALTKGDYASAIAYYTTGLGLKDPVNEQTMRRNLIIAYERSGDFAAAKAAMAEYVQDYPTDEEAARENSFLMTR